MSSPISPTLNPSWSSTPSTPTKESPSSPTNATGGTGSPGTSPTTTTNGPTTHPTFHNLVHHLSQPLTPLVHCTSGKRSPDWPKTIINYHLLTSTQLDNLARFFNQVYPPVPETYWYPRHLEPWLGTPNESEIDLQTRRRRFGYFIGLIDYGRSCESESASKNLKHAEALALIEGPVLARCFEPLGSSPLEFISDDSNVAFSDPGIVQEINDFPVDELLGRDGIMEESISLKEILEWMEGEWELALKRASEEGMPSSFLRKD